MEAPILGQKYAHQSILRPIHRFQYLTTMHRLNKMQSRVAWEKKASEVDSPLMKFNRTKVNKYYKNQL